MFLKITGLVGFGGCCALTVYLIFSLCHLLKIEAGKTSGEEFFILVATFFLFILASIMTVVYYTKIVKKDSQAF